MDFTGSPAMAVGSEMCSPVAPSGNSAPITSAAPVVPHRIAR